MALTQITSEGIKDDEVKTADILNANVTSAKLADGSVTGPKLATESVSTVKIEDGAVTADKLAADVISADKIADNAVVTASINADAVTAAKIADNAVVTAAINADAVTGAKIADDAVGSEHIEVLDAALQFGDSVKAQFGTGNDLEIYHNGSNGNYIKSAVDDRDIFLQSSRDVYISTGDGSTGNHTAIYAQDNAGVELRYDNSKKLETGSGGIVVSGSYYTNDNNNIYIGSDNDLKIYHDGNSYITNTSATQFALQSDDLKLRSKTDLENYVVCTHNGSVDLYYNGAKKLETYADGVYVYDYLFLHDNDKLICGHGSDLQIYHDGSSSYITNLTGNTFVKTLGGQFHVRPSGDEEGLIVKPNGAVELYYDGTKTCYTGTNSLKFDDNKKAIFGGNLELYHDGTNSRIYNSSTNDFYFDTGSDFYLRNTNTEKYIKCVADGYVKLYYNNTEQLETTNSGVLSPGYYISAQDGDKLLTDASQGGGSNTCYIGNAAIQVSSDQRIKKDIVNTTLDATTKLKQIRVVDFKWDDPSDKAPVNRNSRGIWTGCLAQEMVNIFPHVVNAPRKEDNSVDTESERRWGLEYQHLVPALIKGFQEQQAEIETLKTEKTKLQTDLTALTARVAALEAG